ncbi:MAG: single-stranded DNA-binding protein [Candidatus Levybacteria bacterium]|nr:single-stranded DNA-binding protein [Candidatus Levybacteria bacterium]
MARSLNKVELIGNLTRDPELRYTPQGTAVCTFGLATNRSWVTDSGEKKEEADFHRLVAWNKLAELCSQLLTKGRKIYIEGRLSNRSWTGQDGAQRYITEIVINDMIILDSRREGGLTREEEPTPELLDESPVSPGGAEGKPRKKTKGVKTKTEEVSSKGANEASDIDPEDIPF